VLEKGVVLPGGVGGGKYLHCMGEFRKKKGGKFGRRWLALRLERDIRCLSTGGSGGGWGGNERPLGKRGVGYNLYGLKKIVDCFQLGGERGQALLREGCVKGT